MHQIVFSKSIKDQFTLRIAYHNEFLQRFFLSWFDCQILSMAGEFWLVWILCDINQKLFFSTLCWQTLSKDGVQMFDKNRLCGLYIEFFSN